MWMWILPVQTCFIMSSVVLLHIITTMLLWFLHCIWAPFSWMASRGRVLSHSCFISETEPEKKRKRAPTNQNRNGLCCLTFFCRFCHQLYCASHTTSGWEKSCWPGWRWVCACLLSLLCSFSVWGGTSLMRKDPSPHSSLCTAFSWASITGQNTISFRFSTAFVQL